MFIIFKCYNYVVQTEYEQVPTTVFTPLEYGSCGLSEDDANAKFGKDNIVVYHNVFYPLESVIPERIDKDHAYLKLICTKGDVSFILFFNFKIFQFFQERVVGFHILTPNAGEVTQGFAISLKFNATKADFDRLIGIHPTVAENFTTLTIIKKEDQELKADGC